MAKVAVQEVSNLKDVNQLARFCSINFGNIINQINGAIDFQSNLFVSIITANFTAANTSTKFTHTLGRIPQGYILAKSNVSTTIFDGSKDNTSTAIYLQASIIANCLVVVF